MVREFVIGHVDEECSFTETCRNHTGWAWPGQLAHSNLHQNVLNTKPTDFHYAALLTGLPNANINSLEFVSTLATRILYLLTLQFFKGLLKIYFSILKK